VPASLEVTLASTPTAFSGRQDQGGAQAMI
jgi:hypothetical protein